MAARRSASDPSARPRARRAIRLALVVAVTVAVAALGGWWLTRPERFYTDADTIRLPRAAATPRDVLWQPPAPLNEALGLAALADAQAPAYEPRASWDGTTLYFVRGKAGGSADLYVARRTPAGWSEPLPLDEINTGYDELGPEPSADGSALYFYSDRPGGVGGYDLWVAFRRQPAANVFEAAASGAEFEPIGPQWQPPINLGPAVNSEFNEYGPALSRDGRTLYFASNRPQPGDARQPDPHAWPATVREDRFRRTYDLYESSASDAGWATAAPVAALNTPANEAAPCVSPAGDFLYFASDRPGGQGGFDLFRSRRLPGGFSPPENLGPPVNGPFNELDPGLAQLGFALYFSSDRGTTDRDAPAPGPEYALYYTASREVFTDSQARPIDWAALWSAVGPALLWFLLALAALLLLLVFLRDLRNRKLSLLVRCLLVSLAAHCLILLLTSFWKVASGIGELVRSGGGPVQVALAPGGDALAGQIRGGLTRVDPPAAVERLVEAPPPTIEIRPETAIASIGVAPADIASTDVPPVEPLQHEAQRPPTRFAHDATSTGPDPATLALGAPLDAHRIAAAENARPTPPLADPPAPRPPALAALDSPLPNSVHVPPEPPSASPLPAADDVGFALSDIREPRITPPSAPARETPSAVDVATFNLPLPGEPAPPTADDPHVPPSVATIDPREAGAARRRASIAAGQPSLEPITAVRLPPETRAPSLAAALDAPAPREASPAADIRSQPNGDASAAASAAAELPLGFPAETTQPGDATASAAGEPDPVRSLAPLSPSLSPRRSPPTPAIDRVGDGSTRLVAVPPATSPPIGTVPPDVGPLTAAAIREASAPRHDRRGPETDAAAIASTPGPGLDPSWLPLGLPPETDGVAGDYAQRQEAQRRRFLERLGGSDETENAVARALAWLARHQDDDGRWSARAFDVRCGACDGAADANVDVATTGLALLAFLGAGHTHVRDGPHRAHVHRALAWLVARVDRAGDARDGESMYSQGIATIALAEAYGMTRDPALRPVVARAVQFIVASDDKSAGGWRYEPGQPGDTSVLGWQVMALRSAASAGIDVPPSAFDSARRWLDKVSSRTRPGLFAYRPRDRFTQAMTAEGTFVRQLIGDPRDEPSMQTAIEYIARPLPDWKRRLNTYAWYYVTLALFHHGGPHWTSWNQALTRELLAHQRHGGPADGSWDPGGEWAPVGGRIYQTAICTLMLEVYYRHLPLYRLDGSPVALPRAAGDAPFAFAADAIPVGSLRGRVTDADTGAPLEGALVRLDLEADSPPTALTGPDGAYRLPVPRVPDFIAVTATRDGYAPAARNVPGQRLLGGASLQVDFSLRPAQEDAIALEAEPDVHHLGNDRFEGAINSQFQKRSEGVAWVRPFDVPADRIPAPGRPVEVVFLAKGVQCPIRIWINDQLIDDRPSRSPRDGSFGELRVRFDAEWLREGTNTFEIRGSNCTGDLDDFEFVNVQIRLRPATP